ncbi:sorting nexin-1a isoform X2 [Sardina pilchardus]|uniref:sorting nexin-1a isoform X2 n=1 Tax=Sardina pilchardus TaxID=27697 RepID=UPI002E12CCC0
MATSSERTPPPFPESEDMDLDTEMGDAESNENECVVANEDVIGAEAEANNAPDDIFSELPTDSFINPITDSIIKSDMDAIDKQDEQLVDIEPKEEPNKAPDSILWTAQSTTVSKPEDDVRSPLVVQSESVMHRLSANDLINEFSSDSPGKILDECELETDSSPTNDLSQETETKPTGEPVSESQDIPAVDVLLDQASANSDCPGKILDECELETDNGPTNDLFQETEAKPTGEPVSESQDIPAVDVLLEEGNSESDCPGKILDECELETDNGPTNDLSQETEAKPTGEPVSESQDIPAVDVLLEEGNSESDCPGKILDECELETDNGPTNDLSQETEAKPTGEPVSESQDIPAVDVLLDQASANSDCPGKILDECELKIDSSPTNDLSQETETKPTGEPVSESQDIPAVDVLLDQASANSDCPGKILDECELETDNGPTNDLFQETEAKPTGEPVSESQDIPVVDVLLEEGNSESDCPGKILDECEPMVDVLLDQGSAVGENSAVCLNEPLTDIRETPPCDNFLELLSEPASKQQRDLFSDPDDLFSELLNGKNEPKSSDSTDICREAKNTLITGPLGDDVDNPPSEILSEDCVMKVTSPNSDSSSDSRTRDEEQDIFAEATVELSLDSPAIERKRTEPSRLLPAASSTSTSSSMSEQRQKILEEQVEEEDKFELNISVTNPEKVGDGINAYLAYRVSTQTTLPMFKSKTFVVRRRFSDFLGLYEKLSEKLSQNGYIVPPPPEKSILGMTKLKVGKEDPSSAEFVEKRRAALERFLQRVLCHPSLLQDPDVREFLEKEELPRAVNTHAFSGAGFLKIINRATDAVTKMTIKMNESDIWFEEKLQEVEGEDQQLRKLHVLVESLANHRKDLSANTAMFAKSIGMLGSSEDNTALSRALCQLAEVEDKIEQLHQEQAGNDFFIFAELLADYIRLLGAVRGCFDQRMKTWQRWQDAQNMLQKKREAEAKLLWANKPEKLQLAKDEITEWEARVTQYERDFERISATVRKEVIWFEREKAKDFKKQMLKYLQVLLHSQQQLTKYWESFLPEAKAIA